MVRVSETALSLDRPRLRGDAETAQKERNKTSLNKYVTSNVHRPFSRTRKQNLSHSAATKMLGSLSLKGCHDQNLPIKNRINVSDFHSSSSLQVLNQSSTLKGLLNSTDASVPQQSSLKKQEVRRKAPHASFFLGQARVSVVEPLSPSSVKEEVVAEEEVNDSGVRQQEHFWKQPRSINTLANYRSVPMLAKTSLAHFEDARNQLLNLENANNTLESSKHIKRVPKNLIRTSSC